MSNKKGFTIVELIVAMSVFTVMITIAVGVFIQGLRSQRLISHLMAISDNAGLVLEQMAREIRTGYNFPIGGVYNTITFTNFEGENVTYSLAGGSIVRTDASGNRTLTASSVRIPYLSFIVSQQGDICNPWRITILMQVASMNSEVKQTASLQTTVSSRVLPREVPGASPEILTLCGT